MFYDKFKQLCDEKGVSCTRAAAEIGLSNATATKWKKTGATPDGTTLTKVSNYFGVTVGYLLGTEQKETAAIDVVDDGLKEYLDELRTRPEMRMLFSTTKTATKAQIEAIVKFIEGMQDNQ